MIAIMVITHSRVDLLRKCVQNVLSRTTATSEIAIWDNASTDGTADYLTTLTDPRIRVMRSTTNVGMNGYAHAFRATTAPFVVELDDDVVDAPHGWDRMLLDAFEKLPEIGFLSADIVDDPYDPPAHYRYRVRPHEYRLVETNGVPLLEGPAWGGCAITSRELAASVGGFPERRGDVFWLEDAEYLAKIAKLGYRGATLATLKVHHTGGPHYTVASREKTAYWQRYDRRQAQKAAVKRVLLKIPLLPKLNARFGWFQPR
jgi:rhamnopyranosyl-N-acetylglucosaminyl-diphospho-decaprenol beta-1,3/1,4-galactofuranosyltransferase